MKICKTLLAFLVAFLMHVGVASEKVESFVYGGRTWRVNGDVSVSGSVVTVRNPVGDERRHTCIKTDIDLGPYIENGIEWHVQAKGSAVVKPTLTYMGLKSMLVYCDGTGKLQYPGAPGKSGDFGWHNFRYRTTFKNGVKGNATLNLGIQGTSGTISFDLSTLRISSAKVRYAKADADYRCEYSKELSSMPPLRGVMSPSRKMTEEDFVKLESWGVNLLRYQMNRFWGVHDANRDLADYDGWLKGKLDHLDEVVLPLAIRHGIRVVIDLHMPPGGRAYDGEMNMFYEPDYARHFIENWRTIARRFKCREGVCGYDIINEPNQTYVAAPGFDYWEVQVKAAEAIRAIDPKTPIIVESNHWDSPSAFSDLPVLKLKDVIYQVHCYVPSEFTHQGVGGHKYAPCKWPDEKKGWNVEYIRKALEPVRDFERRHGARIYVGEFSAIAWAEGADRYLEDCMSVFNDYGWDWSYHAYGEYQGWSVEHSADKPNKFRPDADTKRKHALLRGLMDRSHPAISP